MKGWVKNAQIISLSDQSTSISFVISDMLWQQRENKDGQCQKYNSRMHPEISRQQELNRNPSNDDDARIE